ncbi:unnamed protein product [Owenia fusiformis]|uniref:Uncharacterized protein n=1 Tax=Owenia fusiformis TaxID=6347 RepID=A0A8S4P7J2_OWEFU|nr:unnamed protein product [Owenia fusiformis]
MSQLRVYDPNERAFLRDIENIITKASMVITQYIYMGMCLIYMTYTVAAAPVQSGRHMAFVKLLNNLKERLERGSGNRNIDDMIQQYTLSDKWTNDNRNWFDKIHQAIIKFGDLNYGLQGNQVNEVVSKRQWDDYGLSGARFGKRDDMYGFAGGRFGRDTDHVDPEREE